MLSIYADLSEELVHTYKSRHVSSVTSSCKKASEALVAKGSAMIEKGPPPAHGFSFRSSHAKSTMQPQEERRLKELQERQEEERQEPA